MNTWTMTLQDSNSPICDLMIFFHDTTMIYLTFITILCCITIYQTCLIRHTNRYFLFSHTLEVFWSLFPMGILILIALPSLKILYMLDELQNNSMTIKVIGNQWFWKYEYSDFPNMEFESYMNIHTDSPNINYFRLLDVNNRCVLPYKTNIRIITTSSDVIHSWTIPSLGIKMDSTPGRLNQSIMYLNRPGLYFGQCSEICGVNHSFMPIVIESTNFINFKKWLSLISSNYLNY